jgi:hypothetical protein
MKMMEKQKKNMMVTIKMEMMIGSRSLGGTLHRSVREQVLA